MKSRIIEKADCMKWKLRSSFAALSLILILTSCSLDGNYDPRENNPTVPAKPNPPNNSIDTDLVLTLRWEAQAADKFDLYFDTQNPPEKIYAKDLTSPELTIYGIAPGAKYFWRVGAKFDDKEMILGDVWNFQTKAFYTREDGAVFTKYRVSVDLPNIVNIMYQVYDRSKSGIKDLTINDLILKEDGVQLTPSVDFAEYKSKLTYTYEQKIILMIDNTIADSIDFDEIKNSALSFVNDIKPNQAVKIYSYADNVELVSDYTSNISELTSAVNSIVPVSGSTNLNEAAITGAEELSDFYSDDLVTQSMLVFLTAHSDSKNSASLNEVLQAIQNKRIYLAAIGEIEDPFSVSLIGNQYYSFSFDYSSFSEKIKNIGSMINDLEDSFYWLVYKSPERDEDFHTLNIELKNNSYSGRPGSSLEVLYLSSGFFDADPGLYINASASNPSGIDTLGMFNGLSRTLTATTVGGDFEPEYTWIIGNNKIVELTLLSENNRARLTAVGSAGDQTELILTDLKNGLQKILVVNIE